MAQYYVGDSVLALTFEWNGLNNMLNFNVHLYANETNLYFLCVRKLSNVTANTRRGDDVWRLASNHLVC